MKWKLKVEDYGKISKAEITVSPFMAFVGDNNSGKSYLLMLLWGIYTIGKRKLFLPNQLKTKEWSECKKWLEESYLTSQDLVLDIKEKLPLIQIVLNQLLAQNKDSFIKELFNYEGMTIGKIEIELSKKDIPKFRMFNRDENRWFGVSRFQTRRRNNLPDAALMFQFLVSACLGNRYFSPFDNEAYDNEAVYLPSARTGFVLTKDIINRVGRNQTFNYIPVINEETDDEIKDSDSVVQAAQPFTRPINHFLDLMTSLSMDQKAPFEELVTFVETHMTKGKVDLSRLPGNELRYIPQGLGRDLPIRVASSVVTELSPLVLFMEHLKKMKGVFYEEPEMGLHPQLQKQVARLLIRMVNQQLMVVFTTHSDTLLQHINNMLKLLSHPDCEALQKEYRYDDRDLLEPGLIRIYQMKDEGDYTSVTELREGRFGFVIPTFNDALDQLLDEVYAFQPEDEMDG